MDSTGWDLFDNLELPALETLIARGARARLEDASIERWLARVFDLGPNDAPAFAPHALRGEGYEPGTDGWICADPVHLRLQSGSVVLADSSQFSITGDEARQMVETLNRNFAAMNFEFVAPAAERWYLRVARAPQLRTVPTAEVTGRNIARHLPVGDEQAYWRRVLNEAQMVLHGHPCNERRESSGQLPINSLWLWGPGIFAPPRKNPHYRCIWSDHPLARGLGRSSNIETQPLADSGAALLDALARTDTGTESSHLIVLPLAVHTDGPAWRDAVAGLERIWLAPLMAGFRERRLSGIALFAVGTAGGWSTTFTRRDRLKFWRRRKRICDFGV